MASIVDPGEDAARERDLLRKSQAGDRAALGELLGLHQRWVFNVVLHMLPDWHEAEDACQEIMLKAVRKLPAFRGDSRFRTWLYRIAVNHVLDLKETRAERDHRLHADYFTHDENMVALLDQELPDPGQVPFDLELLAGEVRIKCMLGMLLCLDRRHRAAFVLGAVLGVSGKVGAEILDMSEASFRKTLSRARRKLFAFLADTCSLVNPGKPCTCARSLPANLRSGYVDPLALAFNSGRAPEIREVLTTARRRLDSIELEKCQELYRSHPFEESPDFSRKLREILESDDMRHFLEAGPKDR